MKPENLNCRKSLFLLLTLIILTLTACGQSETITNEQWIEDIDYFTTTLPQVHKNLYFQLSEQEFKKSTEILKQKIGDLTDREILFEFWKIMVALGDSHSFIQSRSTDLNILPLALYVAEDGIIVLGAPVEYKMLVGKRIDKIERSSTEKVTGKLKEFIPHENEYWLKQKLPEFLINADLLLYTGVISNADSVQLSFKDVNSTKKLYIKTIKASDFNSRGMTFFYEVNDITIPEAWNRGKKYRYIYYPEDSLIYFQYNQCVNDQEESFPDFTTRLFRFMQDKPVRVMVVDVRHNTGGNSALFSDNFMPKLRDYSGTRDLVTYTIIGRRTFSSGLWAAIDMKNEFNTLLVGEPSGNKPNHYGEVRNFMLPNSKFRVTYSIKYWKKVDGDPDALYPDLRYEITWKDMMKGRDIFMEKILEQVKKNEQSAIKTD